MISHAAWYFLPGKFTVPYSLPGYLACTRVTASLRRARRRRFASGTSMAQRFCGALASLRRPGEAGELAGTRGL